MKRGILTDRVEQLAAIRVAFRDQIHFRREGNFIGQIRILPVKRLAADDDELTLAPYAAGSPQDMINVPLLH
jgi:hypothetical protein